MDMNKTITKSKEIEFKYLDDEVYILSLKKGRIYKLDNVGTYIWKLIDGKKIVQDIINILSEKYDVNKENLRKDVTEFINKGVKQKIIECPKSSQ